MILNKGLIGFYAEVYGDGFKEILAQIYHGRIPNYRFRIGQGPELEKLRLVYYPQRNFRRDNHTSIHFP